MKYSLANNGLLSGRADGNVYNRNHTIRGFAMPSNPQTAAQTIQRGNFGSLSGQWNSVLTNDERLAWNAFEINTFDRLGHSVTISGKTAFLLLNRNLFNAGEAVMTSPPTPASPLALTSLSLTATVTGPVFRLTFTPNVPTNTAWLVFATKTFSAGTYKPNPSKFKLITVLPASTTSPQDLNAEYTAVFGALVVDGAVFTRVVPILTTTGFAAPGLTARAIVT